MLQDVWSADASAAVSTSPTGSLQPRPDASWAIQTDVQFIKLTLRPYQADCIDKSLAALGRGVMRQAVSLPVVFSNLITRVPSPHPRATKTLVLAHRKEIIEQAVSQIVRAAPHLAVAVEGAGVKQQPHLPSADVVVASVAALGKKESVRLPKYDPSDFRLVIVDEAHHAAAATYRRIFEHFGLLDRKNRSHILLWGCSATLHRMDKQPLGVIFDRLVYQRGFLQMIREGYLSDFLLQTVETTIDLSDVALSRGDFVVGELSRTVNDDVRNNLIVRAWQNVSAPSNSTKGKVVMKKRRSTLVFAADVAHVKGLTAAFKKAGIEAHGLHGSIDMTTRSNLIDRFRRGAFPVLVNCAILTEGTDIPNIDCVVLARPTRSTILYQQMLGRGLRLYPDKTECLVLEVVDYYDRPELVTAPTLLGLRPNFKMPTGVPFGDVAGQVQAAAETSVDATVAQSLDDIHALLDDQGDGNVPATLDLLDAALIREGSVEVHHVGRMNDLVHESIGFLAQLRGRGITTRLDWFFLRRDLLALKLPSNAMLCIKAEPWSYSVYAQQTIWQVNDSRIKVQNDLMSVFSGLSTIQQVVSECDAWVEAAFPDTHHWCGKTRNALWVDKRSDKQAWYLRDLGFLTVPDGLAPVVNDMDLPRRREIDLARMTMSRAMKWIARLLDGSEHGDAGSVDVEGQKRPRKVEAVTMPTMID
ncbi:hypothetical protein AMAG_00553 [Allomyces macrogynus ATCC 38327]|uniref:P-loop containing nucleoside triphosphate hydrolase protein n=1 Tax=Allomyces macrogynus (strain ATCC 38327) TaxID=578462 RepID=A0A0L0RX09_ALLM3|nr:hypothetical protein AMAG_00553 [Allomyces macrogynus ATCC 38327]|eukprot:KNE54586.1 hypothetical protein AMAG_00553 [Allomyces macrogynus ATCC 38327]